MACHLNRFSSIIDFKGVCNTLGLGLNVSADSTPGTKNIQESKQVEQDLDGWNNNWEWGMEEMHSSHQPLNGTWPSSNCLVSLSSFADTLIIAQGQDALFLTSKWGVEKNEEKLWFSISASKTLTSEPNETVTSVLCLPLASQRRSQLNGPDWTSIAVGFSTGFLRIFSQEGELLVSQCLREGPVRRLLYQSNVNSQTEGSLGDLVAICGDSCVITLDAFTLLQTVRSCRSQLARAKAGHGPMVHSPTLVYKKWTLQDITELSDCCLLGPNVTSPFDQLVWESVRVGASAYPKTAIPSSNVLLCTGLNFFLATFNFTEAGGQLNLSDVMGAVTNKLKTALLSKGMTGRFNLWGRSPSSEDQIPPEPATSVSMKYGFYDKRRKGLSLLLSPTGRLAVLTDSFGRVILVDVVRGICSQMWKGYRDAQCGWVEVEKEQKKPKSNSQRALFLIIYAPRRGILEVWSAPEIFRIAAFTVSKSAVLLCPGYCVMGANVKNLPRSLLYPCCLLEPDGNIANVHIPFNATLKNTRLCPQKDVYLLTDLQQLLREKKESLDREVANLFININSTTVLQKALNIILNESQLGPEFLHECLNNFIKHRNANQTTDIEDPLEVLGKRLLNLLTTYGRLSDLNRAPDVSGYDKELPPDVQILSESLGLNEEEVGQLISLVSLHNDCCSGSPKVHKRMKKVTFSPTDATGCLGHREFLKAFNWSTMDSGGLPVTYSHEIADERKALLGQFIFQSALEDECKVPILVQILKTSSVRSQALLEFLLYHWLSKRDDFSWRHWIHFFKLMEALFKTAPIDWSRTIPLLITCTNPCSAYVTCLLLRTLRVEGTVTDEAKQENEEWETLTEEHVSWNLLQQRLEDVLVLDGLLRCRGDQHASKISVHTLLEKGSGAACEVISEWIVRSELDVHSLFPMEGSCTGNGPDVKDKDRVLKVVWSEMCKRFPRSLERDSVLANCAWEQMVIWSREPDDVARLTATLDTFGPISSAILKNGVGCMMWKTFVVTRFEALAMLIEKVGKTPKERLCKQDLSMSAMYLEPFLEFCSQLLELVIVANVISDVETLPQFPPEDLWREGDPIVLPSGTETPSVSNSKQPLVVLAYHQVPSNYVLLYHHQLFTTALLLIVTFGLKNTRPLSFYDLKGRQAFFRDLQGSYAVPQTSLPFKVVMGRSHFLQKVVSAIAHALPEPLPPASATILSNQPGDQDQSFTMERRKSEREASRWLNRTLELGKGWDVSLDELRRHYICQLYSCSQDSLAEECLSSVTDYLSLGSQLLLLAGQRVASALLGSGHDRAACMAYLPPSLSQWLKALDLSELRNSVSSLAATTELLGHVVNLTSEDSPDNKKALALLDAVVTGKVVFPA